MPHAKHSKFSSLIGIVALALPLSAPVFATTLDLGLGNFNRYCGRRPGLDVIDDMLDEVGVATRYSMPVVKRCIPSIWPMEAIAANSMESSSLTVCCITPGGNYLNSAFTLEGWRAYTSIDGILVSANPSSPGYPASGAYFKTVYDLDYGMDLNTLVAGKSFQGKWRAPAAIRNSLNMNTSNSLPVTRLPSCRPNRWQASRIPGCALASGRRFRAHAGIQIDLRRRT